jgi:transposase
MPMHAARRSESGLITSLTSLAAIEGVRPKYACPACQAQVVVAERLPEPIEKGFPGPGLITHAAVSKDAAPLPLNRQERIVERFGV